MVDDAPDNTAERVERDGTNDAAIAEIWRAAVERYERDTGTSLAEQLDGTPDAASADSLNSFIEERAARFTEFRADGHARARKWLKPIAATVQLLSSCFGDAVTLVRPHELCEDSPLTLPVSLSRR